MKFPFLLALLSISVVRANPTGKWPWRVLQSKPGPPASFREVAAFIKRLEARNISLSLPTHMLSLYRSYSSGNYSGLSAHERPVLPEADTVRSLVAKSFHHNGSRWIVTFDMSMLAANEKLQFAELRISVPAFAESCSLLELHHQSEYPCGPATCQDQLFLGSFPPASVLEDAEGCAIYNVTNILRHWINRSKPRGKGRLTGLQWPESPSCRSKRSLPSTRNEGKAETKETALLLVFSQRPEQSCSESSSLLKDANSSKHVRKPRKRKGCRLKPKGHVACQRKRTRGRGRGKGRAERSGTRIQRRPRHHSKSNKLTRCRRIDFQVKFDKIGWGAWVIFPKTYNAFRCEGECPSPSGENVKPSNHAYMQSLLKFHRPTLVPAPCCVPIKMSPMSMLYKENGEVVLRHHENMVVQECGCR
ncbi:nodal-like [Chiloscyllium punctatum]|uniref:Nodal1 n=1 Tax=Chiloscyllium punctatum TaxID=137246 RepID=A0A401SPZ1_CHIPU|nr:Nodal1 [Chiloscyllium punctatum]GCC32475.1 hypothetical protein [Chiloscyllium punctatum]